MTTKILTIYQAENKSLKIWYNPKNTIPHPELIKTMQLALNEPTDADVEMEWRRADAHREEITQKLLDTITDLTTRCRRQEEIALDNNKVILELRQRIVTQHEKITFLQTCIRKTKK